MRAPLLARARMALRGFCRREDASIALETMIIAPILFWAYMALFVIFDVYRQHAINQKAAYTIGDMVSREDRALGPTYMSGTRRLFDSLARSAQPSSIRITMVQYNAANDRYVRIDSQPIGTVPPATATQVENWDNKLPIMPDGEQITVVETWARYRAPFNIGIGDHDIHNFIFTRHRSGGINSWDEDA